ncbi:hypothetical protein BCR33DRAFT_854563 [Rhizoclosmatium globosum]|uniref:G-protein coupled receptors family 2 profile 2 domain-containing protein n=1 Tax=Rhizoclosmatium globosum TaxID=329046 RepID=A0A1Y2BSU0_9FUNG|nr:hypothetical protein BCR33DRAFT_854563 [Rhizoclosmatium globosum]|eukprot:ORY37811.1 hypothetical protein BCR33DRAFT_854563 [Rhizoclosmatium globosum]
MPSTIMPSASSAQAIIIEVTYPLSIVANVFLVGWVFRVKRVQKTVSYLQVCLALSDILRAIGPCVGTDISPNACNVMAIVDQFAYTSSTSWNLMISVYCYVTIFRNQTVADRLWLWYHMYAHILSILTTTCMFIGQAILKRGPVLGKGLTACWITANYPELRVYLFYVPIWIHFGIMALGIETAIAAPDSDGSLEPLSTSLNISEKTVISTDAVKAVTAKSFLDEATRKLLVRASLIAIGFLFSFGPASVARIMTMYGASAPNWLQAWSTFGMASSSLWNVLVFFTGWYWTEMASCMSRTYIAEGSGAKK